MNLYFYISLLLLFSSIMLFNIGYHAVDLSYNVLRVSYYENTNYYDTYTDTTLGNDINTIPEMYRKGWIFCFSSFSLLFMAVYFAFLSKENKRLNCIHTFQHEGLDFYCLKCGERKNSCKDFEPRYEQKDIIKEAKTK